MSKQSLLILPDWTQPIVLGLIVLLVYIATLTSWHSGDDLQLALKVESAITGQPVLHPAFVSTIVSPPHTTRRIPPEVRYFLELPTLQQIGSVSRIMNWSERATLPIQLTHVVFGTIAVVFFFLALVRFVPRNWSFVISLGLAFSYAWWYYSTHLDYTINSHAMSCIFLYLLVLLFYSKSEARLHWRVLALGIVNALAILYLLTNILLIPVALVALLLSKKSRFDIALYLFSMILTVVIVGSGIWMMISGEPPSLARLVDNLTYSEAYAHGFALSDIPKSLYGFSKALVIYPILGHQSPNELYASSNFAGRIGFVVWHVLLSVIAMLPFVLLARLHSQLEMHRNLATTLVVWFTIQIPFGIYWEPSYIKWWTGVLIPWWGLIGLLMAVTSARSLSLHKTASMIVSSLILLFFSVSLFSDFLPNSIPDRNRWIQIANTLGDATGRYDLFISPRFHPLDFYLPYFARRYTLSYETITLTKGQAVASRDIHKAIRITTERGGRIFLYSSEDENFLELKNIITSPSINYKRIRFEHLSTPDFILYQVTGLYP